MHVGSGMSFILTIGESPTKNRVIRVIKMCESIVVLRHKGIITA